MFTGIVETLGTVSWLQGASSGWQLRVQADRGYFESLALGASVAVNGVCLSIVERTGSEALFDVIPETWSRTALSALTIGDQVNLERSLRAGASIDGHFVQGHIDAVGRVSRIETEGQWKLWARCPNSVMPYMVEKGSIALDGVSLTLVDVTTDEISVALIPTTLRETTLGRRAVGAQINVESDILARMVVKRLGALVGQPDAVQPPSGSDAGSGMGGVTLEQLRDAGFMRSGEGSR